MPPDEQARTIGQCGFACGDRQLFAPAVEIGDQGRDAAIAPGLLHVPRHGGYGAQIFVRVRAGEGDQNDAQRINVVGNRRGRAGDARGAGICPRHRQRAAGLFPFPFQQPGNAEIEQLHARLRIHEDVGGLEVRMNDEPGMGELHGVGGLDEQHDPLLQRLALHRLVDRQPVDIFHDQIGRSLRADAAVDQPGDVGMLEPSENAALGAEGLAGEIDQPRADELDRDLLIVEAVIALAEPDAAHAAEAQAPNEAERAGLRAGPGLVLADLAARQFGGQDLRGLRHGRPQGGDAPAHPLQARRSARPRPRNCRAAVRAGRARGAQCQPTGS